MPRKTPPPRGPQLKLAGSLGVAFVNTAGARKQNRQQGITNYAELVVWGQQTGVLSTLEAERLSGLAAERPAEADAVFTHAVRVRSALFRIFAAVMTQEPLPAEDLALVGEAWGLAMAAARLVPGETGITIGWTGDEDALDRMLWPVLHSVSELLVSLEGRPLVRQCGAKNCLLFFVDRTPSRRRRWCESKVCGHRVAALAHYHRSDRAKRRY